MGPVPALYRRQLSIPFKPLTRYNFKRQIFGALRSQVRNPLVSLALPCGLPLS